MCEKLKEIGMVKNESMRRMALPLTEILTVPRQSAGRSRR